MAGRFALGLGRRSGSLELRLLTANFPDFEMRQDATVHPFEITDAVNWGGKASLVGYPAPAFSRGREPASRGERDLREPENLDRIRDRIRKKSEKRYTPIPHLLIHANFRISWIDPREIRKVCQRYENEFPSVWILNAPGTKFLQLFNNNGYFNVAPGVWNDI